MTRKILCNHCSDKFKELLNLPVVPTRIRSEKFKVFGDEHIKFVHGTSIRKCVCDDCNTPIIVADECYAVSIHKGQMPFPDWDWEKEYLQLPGVTPTAGVTFKEIDDCEEIQITDDPDDDENEGPYEMPEE